MLPNENIAINVYREGVLTGSDFSRRGYLAISEDILDCHCGGGGSGGVTLVSRSRDQGDKA